MTLEVVKTPRDLAPEDRHLRSLGAQGEPRPVEGLLERGQRRFVVAPVELGRAKAVESVDVVGIAVERGRERRGGHLIAPEPQPAPPQTVVQALPRRLTPKRGLERDRRAAEIAQEILGPAEKRPRLIV